MNFEGISEYGSFPQFIYSNYTFSENFSSTAVFAIRDQFQNRDRESYFQVRVAMLSGVLQGLLLARMLKNRHWAKSKFLLEAIHLLFVTMLNINNVAYSVSVTGCNLTCHRSDDLVLTLGHLCFPWFVWKHFSQCI